MTDARSMVWFYKYNTDRWRWDGRRGGREATERADFVGTASSTDKTDRAIKTAMDTDGPSASRGLIKTSLIIYKQSFLFPAR